MIKTYRPVLTGMPSGNEKRDKIVDFLIVLDKDRARLNGELASLKAERATVKYQMHKIVAAVNQIQNQQL